MSGFVTFKADQDDREARLRAPEPVQNLHSARDVFAAWPVQLGGSGQPPGDLSELFFRQGRKFPGTNIVQLELISEPEYDRIRSSGYVARFSPYKEFIWAARKAANSA